MGRLFWKFFVFLFLAQLATAVGVGLSIWWQVKQEQAKQELATGAGIEATRPARGAIEAAAATLQFGGVNGLQSLLRHWQPQRVPQVFAVNAQGQELMQRAYSSETLLAASKLANSRNLNNIARYISLPQGQRYLLFVPDDGVPDKGLRPPRHRLPPKFYNMYPVKPLLAGALVSLTFAAILAWYFSRPIKNLRHAFQQATQGNLQVSVSKSMGGRRDELADLGRDFDAMAVRLGNLLQGQTRLLHHVSHELRSPLARIQMALGLAEQDEKNVDDALKRVELEASRMDKMVGELLELSRLESGVMHLKKESLDLVEMLAALLEDAAFEAKAKQLTLVSQLPDQCLITAQSDLLYRAIENVMRNAIKYAPAASEISLLCLEDKPQNAIHITISDQGSGVADHELADIFKPFIRGNQGSQTVGHGIGLAIAKQVIEAHGGQVQAKNLQPAGFSVQITLPARQV